LDTQVRIVAGWRTAYSKYGGALKDWSSVDIGSHLLSSALPRLGFPAEHIDLFICGTAFQAEVANHTNINARQILLKSGLPPTIPSYTVDQASCTGMAAVILGRQAILAGEAEVVVVMGAEALCQTPFLVAPNMRWGRVRGDFAVRDPLFPMRFPARPGSIIADVDAEAGAFAVDRRAMDEWALESQKRFAAAKARGFFRDEILPVRLADGTTFVDDEAPRPASSMEKLATLPTVHGSDLITAGNAPGMETGATMLVLMSPGAARKHGVDCLATLEAAHWLAGDVEAPLSQCGHAATAVLRKAGRHLRDVDFIEIEEDFAAVVPIAARMFERDWGLSPEETSARTNVNGGAIAVGHPIGPGGVRIVLTLARQLEVAGAGLGLAAIAGGLSQGDAVLVTR
jgi:acetyl-CoA C-acetyltransferase